MTLELMRLRYLTAASQFDILEIKISIKQMQLTWCESIVEEQRYAGVDWEGESSVNQEEACFL